ncbi:acyltransferase family protein [Thalassotalea atypica]|uniref:acyltransferase family protein n=1 Tax=Thalassotalea atypica TaxID=2054316 RepID=UPI002572E88D|nr:acyltransferase family protein [Thalassotalea atypica]
MPSRRHDLDWLRIIVFGLLIFYHVGMLYVENWGFHMKSVHLSQSLESIMLIIEPWRMAVLWLISGIAIRFFLVKVNAWRFAFMRSLRLLLPLLFGVLVIVPPQLYVEMTSNGDLSMSYGQFLMEFFSSDSTVFEKYQAGIWPHVDVNHLWYLRSLWQYSLVLLALVPILNTQWFNRLTELLFKLHGALIIAIALLPIAIIQLTWDMDTARYPLGFTFLLYGYCLGWHPIIWQKLATNVKRLCLTSAIVLSLFISFYSFVWLPYGDSANKLVSLAGMIAYSACRVICALTVLALAYKYLNVHSNKLTYFNDAVYPFYILHQTIILVVAFYFADANLGPVVEPITIIFVTVVGCFLGFEAIRRTMWLRPFFGLKISSPLSVNTIRLSYLAGSILILPIAWEVLL